MFRKLACVVAICAVLPLGGAYARGPLYTDHHASEPAVAADMGRIYLYRPSSFWGMALEPKIMVDGVKVGDSEVGNYIYIDRPPGTYTITTTTEKEESVSVPLAAGQTVYVRFRVSFGVIVGHVIPALVDDMRGTSEIKDCHYVGTDGPAAPATALAAPATPAAPDATPAAAPAASTAPAVAPAADAPAQTPQKN